MYRNVFVVEIPPDTEWFEVRYLTDDDLGELRAVNFGDWTVPEERNELSKIAMRKQLPLRVYPSNWEPPILWSHSRNGPFAILEGNNRLTAYAGSGRSDLKIPALVGLSPMACVWHISDHCGFLMQDLIRP
jgi:hypothetical protein